MNEKAKLLHAIECLQADLKAYHSEIFKDDWVRTDSAGVPMITTSISRFGISIHQKAIEFQTREK